MAAGRLTWFHDELRVSFTEFLGVLDEWNASRQPKLRDLMKLFSILLEIDVVKRTGF